MGSELKNSGGEPTGASGSHSTSQEVVGIVVIGRNEGERLVRALRSVPVGLEPVVYVDSASTDGSARRAHDLGMPVHSLDAGGGLTAAKARNAGFLHLKAQEPAPHFVQFLDGDSELTGSWISTGSAFLSSHPDVGIVCGRLTEVDRDRSIYRRLMDMEWNRQPGQVDSCGGIFMARTAAFEQAGMFDPAVPYGEEAELCVRLRAKGWIVIRLATPMAVHDSGMSRFDQWWRRCVRGGRAYAAGVHRYASADGGANLRRLASCVAWGLVWPTMLVASVALWLTLGQPFMVGLLLTLALPPVGILHTAMRLRKRFGSKDSWLYAVFCMLGKFPECCGAVSYLMGPRRGDGLPT